jgi:hypothetical protein
MSATATAIAGERGTVLDTHDLSLSLSRTLPRSSLFPLACARLDASSIRPFDFELLPSPPRFSPATALFRPARELCLPTSSPCASPYASSYLRAGISNRRPSLSLSLSLSLRAAPATNRPDMCVVRMPRPPLRVN